MSQVKKLFAIALKDGWVSFLTCGGDDWSTWPGPPLTTNKPVLEPHEVLTRRTHAAAERVLGQMASTDAFEAVIVELHEVQD